MKIKREELELLEELEIINNIQSVILTNYSGDEYGWLDGYSHEYAIRCGLKSVERHGKQCFRIDEIEKVFDGFNIFEIILTI